MSLTPMMKQYAQIKEQHQDCILMFRLGDFYEMFGQDALEASKILNITLTARNKGTDHETPMCGIPYHAADSYISKLTKVGKKVAICEQVSEPNAKGIVDREVVRIITPGTTLDDQILGSKKNNYLMSVDFSKKTYGLAFLDLSTGDFQVSETDNLDLLLNEIHNLNPSEILISSSLINQTSLVEKLPDNSIKQEASPLGFKTPEEIIVQNFNIKSLKSFGLEDFTVGLSSIANIIIYINETQKSLAKHLHKITPFSLDKTMVLDQATIRNLEIFYNNQDFTTQGSLLSVIDKTVTAMGGRLLRHFLAHPLINKEEIQERLQALDLFYNDFDLREKIITLLKKTCDLERLLGRLGCDRANARDLLSLKETLKNIPELYELVKNKSELKNYIQNLAPQNELVNLLEESIVEDPPVTVTQGGMIKKGFNSELDELLNIATSGKDFIAKLQAQEIQRTKISSLKIKFNKVFGYYIEVSKANLKQVPPDYQRKQTLVNAERFITPELKEYEEKILTAEEKIKEIEYNLFQEIRAIILQKTEELIAMAKNLAYLDVFSSLAQLALNNDYHKPEINDSFDLEITAGRHPVIEAIQKNEPYIPNDGLFDTNSHQLILLTGPNMSGKSSYLRQTALIVLLAQIGSFVPAQSAKIGVVDRIFTRVGASDNLKGGQSTFMVEMQEAANIINNATSKSLIILDELGRGTSTYDGISIAWAIIEYIHNHIRAKTIFATHYHELIELAENLDYAQNYSVAVKEEGDKVVFLRKIIKGGINKSYGIEVAKIAGLPQEIIKQAKALLKNLEKNQPSTGQQKTLNLPISPNIDQIKLEITNLNLDELSPRQAWDKLKRYQDELKD